MHNQIEFLKTIQIQTDKGRIEWVAFFIGLKRKWAGDKIVRIKTIQTIESLKLKELDFEIQRFKIYLKNYQEKKGTLESLGLDSKP